MKVLVAVLFFFIGVKASVLNLEWEIFKNQYGKTYLNAKEHSARFDIFRKNLEYINEHNKLYEAGESTFSLGVNEYTDMTNEEFVKQFNGLSGYDDSAREKDVENLILTDLPDSVDWRTKGYVTPVKNQGQCGSCWSFSATGSIEGAHFKATNKLVSLSEQNLVDCDKKSNGCEGGLMDYAFKYVIKNKGIDTEESYPYKAKDQKCKAKKGKVGATISSFKDVQSGSEQSLQAAVAQIGPVSVAIDASNPSFQHYKQGVYNEPNCSSKQLDHGVLAVGYGKTSDNIDYWIVKNSWGASWGNKGYLWMSRNKNNQCGIATMASYPIV